MPNDRFINLNIHKKNNIEQALIIEMMRVPYEHINLSNIIRHANISRGSFYQYFSNKNDFYDYILNQLGIIKATYINNEMMQDASIRFLDKLSHILEASILFSKSHPNFVKIGLQLYASTHQKIQSFINQSQLEMEVLLQTWFNQDPSYSTLENQEALIRYISDTMIYLTQYTLKFNTMVQLENHLLVFMKLLKGGIHNV
jgi:AcrR family transcriptional regulator